MYRSVLLSLCFVLFWATTALAEGANLESIPTRSSEQIDLTETLLAISKEWNPQVDEADFRKQLDQLTEWAQPALSANSPREKVDLLRRAIHGQGGYRYTDEVDARGFPVNSEELFMHGLLKTKRGYCMNLSLLYLVVAERLGLPIKGVALPNHFFVRWDDGTERINIDGTEGGAEFSDGFYLNRFGMKGQPVSAFYLKSLNKKQTLGAYFSNVGMVFYQNLNSRKAVFYLSLSVAINPLSVEAHNNLGNMYSELNENDQAIQQYQRAVAAEPGNADSYFNLGMAYDKAGNTDQAVESLLQAVQLNPGFPAAHDSLARLFLFQRNYAGALLHLKKLSSLAPESVWAFMEMSTAYLGLGVPEIAVLSLRHTVKRFPDLMQALEKLAEILYRMGDYDQALEQQAVLVDRWPDFAKGHIQMGWTYYKRGDIANAIKSTEKGLAVADKASGLIPLAEMNLGLFSLLEGQYDRAKSFYNKALIENAESLEGILADLEEARSGSFSDKTELDYFSGWVLHSTGKVPAAEKFFQRYLQRDPEGLFADEVRSALQSEKEGLSGELALKNVPEGMVFVPKGYFIMGSDDHGLDEAPQHKTYLDAYYIDQYEVRAKDFAEFLNSVNNTKGYYEDNVRGVLVYNDRFSAREGMENLPINNVNWYGASKYCEWKKQRLPTEAEWEKAARGPSGNIYPWGNTLPHSSLARYNQHWTEEIKHGVMMPVDSYAEGKSFYGTYNMAGNVKEWVDDWFDREYYDDPANHINPPGQIGGEFKVLKGGSWRDLSGFLYASFRNNSYPDTRMADYGFRCAKSAEGKKIPQGKRQLTQWKPWHLLHRVAEARY
ncbi:MAG: hypothetical protein COV66_02110 [Nitrospinae bacterium CG11_big_fil_rev_8_21_14_0_20_45_15]|nr:MAG: hypothetical protein COV66_02110 [Nitrospinae bacterium CG11_big_fil_rev_8_21_14_0_20_45_15]